MPDAKPDAKRHPSRSSSSASMRQSRSQGLKDPGRHKPKAKPRQRDWLLISYGLVIAVLILAIGGMFAWQEARQRLGLDRSRPLRVAAYNIQFLKANDSESRFSRLRGVVDAVDADIWALEEIEGYDALARLFPTRDWALCVQDLPDQNQEVALAVRKPLRFEQDRAMLIYPSDKDDNAFPNSRDLLWQTVVTTGGHRLHLYVVHAKSRLGGTLETEDRRREHAQKIVAQMRQHSKDDLVVVLGDFNDTPDDPGPNILETGDLDAQAELEERPDTFLVNLGEPLWALDGCSLGVEPLSTSQPATQPARLPVRTAGARAANWARRSNPSMPYGAVLFDLIFVSPPLARQLAPGSLGMMRVYDGPDALDGGADRPSDHLPIFADFVLR